MTELRTKMVDGKRRGSSRRKTLDRFPKAKNANIGWDQSAAMPVRVKKAWLDRDEYETTPHKPPGEISIFTLCRFDPWFEGKTVALQ